ncbi:MAG: hypothetical protein HYS04_09045 [Acidobacteria bacterium]|nr:hypothetical protein [Acidobacteriota bacterium]
MERAVEWRFAGLAIAVLALVLSLAFVLLVYPSITDPYDAVLDPDRYGPLGFGIWKNGTLAQYPDPEPSVLRGPVYPVFMAACLAVTNGVWPGSVQVGQSLLFAATTLLVFWIAQTLWNRRVAIAAQLACAFHPLLLWYTSRIWIETVLTFLFTALIAAITYFTLRPTPGRAVLPGCTLGVAALAKSVFVPFVVILPLVLVATRLSRPRAAVCAGLAAALWILP